MTLLGATVLSFLRTTASHLSLPSEAAKIIPQLSIYGYMCSPLFERITYLL
jgi:hypothetical protein